MADIQATLGLNRREFTTGLRDAEREGAAWARGMEKTFGSIDSALKLGKLALGGGMLGHAFKEGTEAVREFAKYNSEAQRTMQEWDASISGLKAGVGAVLYPAMQALVAVLDEYTDGLGSAILEEQKSITQMNKTQEAIKAVTAARQADDKFLRDMKSGGDKRTIESIRLTGDERRADIMEAQAPWRKQIQDLEFDPNLSDEQKRLRRQRLETEMNNAAEWAGEKFDIQRGRSQKDALRDAGFEAEGRRLNLLRMQGFDLAAANGQINLEAGRSIAGVNANKNLDPAQKESIIQTIKDQAAQAMLIGTNAEVDDAAAQVATLAARGGAKGSKMLYAGLGSALATQAIFGGGEGSYAAPSNDPLLKAQERLEKAQKEQTRVLEAIRENTGRSQVAIAA